MVPDVEEVASESNPVSFFKVEIPDQGEVPILFEWTTINVPAEAAETGGEAVAADDRGGDEGAEIDVMGKAGFGAAGS